MSGRYTLGPCLGGEPPYCFVYDTLQPSYPLIVTGPNIPVAEERAKGIIAYLNEMAKLPLFDWLDEKPHAGELRVVKGGKR